MHYIIKNKDGLFINSKYTIGKRVSSVWHLTSNQDEAAKFETFKDAMSMELDFRSRKYEAIEILTEEDKKERSNDFRDFIKTLDNKFFIIVDRKRIIKISEKWVKEYVSISFPTQKNNIFYENRDRLEELADLWDLNNFEITNNLDRLEFTNSLENQKISIKK